MIPFLLGISLLAATADGGPAASAEALAADAGTSGGDDLASLLDAAATSTPPATTPAPTAPNPVARVFQSLNPDVSVILDGTAGVASGASYSLAGDDPVLLGATGERPAGFTLQEAEVALQAVVDPYFKAELYLTIPNLSGLEVEEAVVTSTSLPLNLQARAGVFRSALGRQNGQHLHLQDFTRRPLLNEAYLGPDGLRAPGVQLSWLAPTPFFLQLTGEAFSVAPPDSTEHLSTFGGGRRVDPTYTLALKAFAPAGESVSVYGGLDAAFGNTAGVGSGEDTLRAGARTTLLGANLYAKYKPPNVTGGYFSLAFTCEYFVRQVEGGPGEQALRDGGLYAQLVAQVARRWMVGLREDLLGVPSSALQRRVTRTSVSVTYLFSEFARLRGSVEREAQPDTSADLFTGAPTFAAFVQLEVALGAHGAHPF